VNDLDGFIYQIDGDYELLHAKALLRLVENYIQLKQPGYYNTF